MSEFQTRTCYTLVRHLISEIFQAEHRRLEKMLVDINQRNKLVSNLQVDGFLYRGEFYVPTSIGTMRHAAKQIATAVLSPLMEGEMNQYIRERYQLGEDREKIHQLLFNMLNGASNDQDMRDAIPDCLIQFIPNYINVPRQKDVLYTITGNKFSMAMYEKYMPKIEYYIATRLMY